ncbi:Hypothetical protein FKW44_013705, partial [Caligus rogercresseyi]
LNSSSKRFCGSRRVHVSSLWNGNVSDITGNSVKVTVRPQSEEEQITDIIT